MPQGRGARLSLVHVRPTLHFFSWATAASAAWKPILLWVPSQKGLVTDAPHRHNANLGPRPLVSTLLPLTSTNSTSPSTRYGPLGRMLIFTAMRHLLTRLGIGHTIAWLRLGARSPTSIPAVRCRSAENFQTEGSSKPSGGGARGRARLRRSAGAPSTRRGDSGRSTDRSTGRASWRRSR